MAGRTKLYQQAKSPLIQGQSKYDRPSWQPWLAATLGGWVIAFALDAAIVWWRFFSARQQEVPLGSYVRAGVSIGVFTLAISAVVAALVVWIGGNMGWRRRVLGASITAGLIAAAVSYPALVFADIYYGVLS